MGRGGGGGVGVNERWNRIWRREGTAARDGGRRHSSVGVGGLDGSCTNFNTPGGVLGAHEVTATNFDSMLCVPEHTHRTTPQTFVPNAYVIHERLQTVALLCLAVARLVLVFTTPWRDTTPLQCGRLASTSRA